MIEEKINPTGQQFANEMIEAERDTLLKINEIARKYQIDPFRTIECFAVHILDINKRIEEKNNKKQGGSNEY